MTEHVHNWMVMGDIKENLVSGDDCFVTAECLSKDVCGETLDWSEINRRLNATERLSAEEAEVAARTLLAAHDEYIGDKLFAYASALGGEDE